MASMLQNQKIALVNTTNIIIKYQKIVKKLKKLKIF